jgi:hypothetical protein
MTIFAVAAFLAGGVSGSAHADPYTQGASPSGKFEYGPYGSAGNPSTSGNSDQAAPYTYRGPDAAPTQNSEDGTHSGPPPEYGDAAPPAGNEGSAYGGDARGEADPDADDNGDDRAEGPPPQDEGPAVRDGREPYPGQAAGPPPGGYAVGLPRIEVRASAPDRSIPYEVREHDARRAAIQAWRGKVGDQFGPQFAHWRAAIGKRVDCHPDSREGLVCIAGAQPVRGFNRYGQRRDDDRR